MSTQLVRLAAAVLSSEKGRKTVGWVLGGDFVAGDFTDSVLVLCRFRHSRAQQCCCIGGVLWTELSASVPEEYRMQLTQMRGSFSHLDAAVAEVNQKAEGNRLDPIQVKAVFFALCFGADTLSQTDAEAFVACFCETETRGREETGETYEVAVPLQWIKTEKADTLSGCQTRCGKRWTHSTTICYKEPCVFGFRSR